VFWYKWKTTIIFQKTIEIIKRRPQTTSNATN